MCKICPKGIHLVLFIVLRWSLFDFFSFLIFVEQELADESEEEGDDGHGGEDEPEASEPPRVTHLGHVEISGKSKSSGASQKT